VFPTPVITVSGSTTFCAGGTRTLTSDNGNGKFTGYTWNPGGTSGNSLTVSQSGVYTVTATNGTCTATSLHRLHLLLQKIHYTLAATLVTPTSCENATMVRSTWWHQVEQLLIFMVRLMISQEAAINSSLYTVTTVRFSQSNGKLVIGSVYNNTWGNAIATNQIFSIAGDVTIEGSFNLQQTTTSNSCLDFASTGIHHTTE
jgi:hypothetical protein